MQGRHLSFQRKQTGNSFEGMRWETRRALTTNVAQHEKQELIEALLPSPEVLESCFLTCPALADTFMAKYTFNWNNSRTPPLRSGFWHPCMSAGLYTELTKPRGVNSFKGDAVALFCRRNKEWKMTKKNEVEKTFTHWNIEILYVILQILSHLVTYFVLKHI